MQYVDVIIASITSFGRLTVANVGVKIVLNTAQNYMMGQSRNFTPTPQPHPPRPYNKPLFEKLGFVLLKYFVYILFQSGIPYVITVKVHPMYGVKNSTNSTGEPIFSPVTLSDEWPKVGRLIFVVTLCTLGTTLNGFFVASFFVESSLRKIGLVFLACVGMADMLITSGAMAVSSVILLAGEWDNLYVCSSVHFLGITSTYCFSMLFMFVALEDYMRLCCSTMVYNLIIKCNASAICVTIFILSFSLAGIGVYMNLDYDYCARAHYGNRYFRAVSGIIFHAAPSVLTTFCLISSYLWIKRRALKQVNYRRSYAYGRDYSYAVLNIVSYLVFIFAWLPYLITLLDIAYASNSKYYYSVWFGQGRAAFTSFMYPILNRNFRRAFAHLFNYCCCKSNLSAPLANRHRREYSRPLATRVRVLHPNMFIARSAQLRTYQPRVSTHEL
ncbi:unnamed protein product [Leptosia nina]|uniref:G-protein coupled receptors family 1 profile domain-containing protein n=1 Tax=Leptosia nina TaxID=320188 RepID=A0AAV1K1S2_9NEOP